jgi:spartin
LLTTISAASAYYINNSNPSPYHSSQGTTNPSGSSDAHGTAPYPVSISSASMTLTVQDDTKKPQHLPPPPTALVLLTSSKTRQGLSVVHGISTEAAKVSSKTVELVDGMIQQVMGRSKTQTPESTPPPSQSSSPEHSLHPSAACPPPLESGTLIPMASTTSPSGAQPRTQVSGLLISADLILSSLNNSTRRVFTVGTEQFEKIVSHK